MAIPERSVWAVSTEGIDHDPADARALTYLSTGGVSGLVAAGGGGLVRTPGDSTSVRILPCSVAAVSRYPGHVNQSYSFRVKHAIDVPIRPAGSAGGRTDAIILRVNDYQVEHKPVPEDPQFWEPVVLEGVPSSTGYTEDGIAAWKNITYPFVFLGTAHVSKDQSAVDEVDVLAETIAARKDFEQQIYNVPSADEIQRNLAYQTIGPTLYFNVPRWANYATVTATVMGVYNRGRSSAGLLSGLAFGQTLSQTRWDIDINTDVQSGSYVRGTYVVAGEVEISEARRGATQEFKLRATNEQAGSSFGVNSGSSIHLRVDFEEHVDLGW